MLERVIRVLSDLRSNSAIPGFDESATKQIVILRILRALTWDQDNYDELTPEYDVGGGRVDYSLRLDGSNKVFIEAKRASESLERHDVQLLNYSFRNGVRLAILTNGMTWWLYLPLKEGNWEDRRFCIIDIGSQDVSQAAQWFVEFLGRENVQSGAAVAAAERRLDGLRHERIIHQTLPRAWEKLIKDRDERLVALIASQVDTLCGLTPEPDIVLGFLNDLAKSMPSIVPPDPTPDSRVATGSPARASNALRDSTQSALPRRRLGRLTGFRFQGEQFAVSKWYELIESLSETIYRRHRADFDRVQTLRGYRRVYYSRNREDHRQPRPVGDSGYYVETHWARQAAIERCHELLELFGYRKGDLEIHEV